MADIQFDRGYVNAEAAAAGRFGGGGTSVPVEDGEADFGFDDFLDIINPLQHIPLVSTLYREITGDEIAAPARVFGGTLFGGPTGFLSAMVNTMFDEIAGEDIGTAVVALFDGESAEEPQVAQPAGSSLTADQAEALNAVPLVTASGTLLNPAALRPAAGNAVPRAVAPPPPSATSPQSPPPATRQPVSTAQESRNDGMLTGQDALNALFNDLRGGSPTSVPLPAAAVPQTGFPAGGENPRADRAKQSAVVEKTDGAAAGQAIDPHTNPLIAAAEARDPANGQALADQMLMALDKYRAMTEQRRQGKRQPSLQVPSGRTPPTP